MIKNFRQKGIERFFKTGVTSGIQAKHALKLRVQLTALNVAKKPSDMFSPKLEVASIKRRIAKRSLGNIC